MRLHVILGKNKLWDKNAMRDVSFNDSGHAAVNSAAANVATSQAGSTPLPLFQKGRPCLHSLFIGRISEIFNYKYQKTDDISLILSPEFETMDKSSLKLSDSEIVTVSMSVFKDACKHQDCYYLTMTLSQPFGDSAHHVHLLAKFAIDAKKIMVIMKDNTPSDSLCGRISECVQKAIADNDSALTPILRKITDNLKAGEKNRLC
ncbi:TPA: hypothetical protein ACSCYS_003457 [Aeromonas veronii]